MNPNFDSLAALPSGAPLLALLAKVTLLLAAASLVAGLLRRHAAATRHLVWLAALAGTLALAVLSPVVPRLEVALPALAPASFDVSTASVPTPGAIISAAFTLALRNESLLPSPAAGRVASPSARNTSGATLAPESDAAFDLASSSARVTVPRPRPDGRLAANVLAALWLAGFIAVLLWSLLGHMALVLLARGAQPVEPRFWHELLAGSTEAARAARAVRLAVSPRVGAPLMWGWPRPVFLLPSAALAWPGSRLRDALLHELAHVTRGDYLAQTLGTLACAVFWFHPLAWHAAARLRSECEHACDDRVLAAGTAAPEYATSLLEVARAARTLRGAGFVAVGMARRSHLEGRLLAVLDESRPRATLSRRAIAAALAATALVLVPLAALAPRPAAATAAREPASATPRALSRSTTTSMTSDQDGTPEAGGGMRDTTPHANFHRRLAAEPGGTLELELTTGATVEIAGWDEPWVDITGTLGGKDWRDSRVEAGANPNPSGVLLRTWQLERNESNSTSHAFSIRVPARYDVNLKSAGGGISIVGVEGTFRGITGGGDVHLERDRGRADLSTGGGDIEVTDCALAGNVSSGGGHVRIERSSGGLVGSSGSGGVRRASGDDDASGDEDSSDAELKAAARALAEAQGHVQIAEPFGFSSAPRSGGSGFVYIQKAGGEVDVPEAPQGAYIMTGGGEVHVGPAAGTVGVSTGGGRIEVGPVAGSVWAGTGSGAVTVRLADPHGRRQDVDVSSGTGKVVLELPEGLDARFDLETAYTDNLGHDTSIDSAWDLEQSRTRDWDDRHGTPRRYVRAHGVAGSGRGLIRVRTVNGDIEVRRVKD